MNKLLGLGSILLCHVLILTKLIYFPYPELFIYPYLTNHGLKPYSQILDQHFPGLLFLPINFENLGMNNEHVARVWSIIIVILTQLLIFYISSKIFKSKKKALLVNFLYLVWQPFFEGWVLWIDSFLPLIQLNYINLLYRNKLFWGGLFLGMGVVFKQTLIPLSLLSLIYIFWQTKNLKQTTIFILGFLSPVLLMLGYLISIGVIKDFWYWTVIFNITTYVKYGTSIPSSIGFVTRILFVYLPSILILFNKDKKLMYILSIYLVGSLAGIFDRANFIHFQPSLPFAILATTAGINKLNKNNVLKILLVFYLLIVCWWLYIFYKGHLGNKVFFFDRQTKLLASKIKQYTKPNDKIFIFGAAPHLYQMSNRLPSGDLFVFQFPWFLQVAGHRVLDGLIKDKPKVIVSDRNVVIDGQPIIEFASDIDQYIQKNYQIIDNVGSTSILRHKAE